ncbi:MAG: hypothetical protein PSX80_10310 [bacterium]|nr:hypothetical protein [bacterium]
MGFASWKLSDDGTHRIIYDDNGREVRPGSVVLVNGNHAHVIHFEGNEICIHDWPASDFIFSVVRLDSDEDNDDWPEEF